MPTHPMDLPFQDAMEIWQAGVQAVQGVTSIRGSVHWDGRWLTAGANRFDLSNIKRVVIVGAGKATAAMADGLISVFQECPKGCPQLVGWINVPEGSFDPTPRRPIHVHAARPVGMNEPTPKAMQGAQAIFDLVSATSPDDFVICLLSGGGSALLPLPIEGVSLEDKLAVTRWLSHRGARIDELNAVRRALSRIKDGKLALATKASHLLTLVLSDVLGDPLHLIASGPTWVQDRASASQAHQLLRRFAPQASDIPSSVWKKLEEAMHRKEPSLESCLTPLTHLVVGNNALAVAAAAKRAERLGYQAVSVPTDTSEGDVEEVAKRWLNSMESQAIRGKWCLLSGGEPTVSLPDRPGKGGRNQQLILWMLQKWIDRRPELPFRCILSAGTDGEDGPTDAAGAWIDPAIVSEYRTDPDEVRSALQACDAYPFFERSHRLVRTGLTGTNVCDLRVALFETPS